MGVNIIVRCYLLSLRGQMLPEAQAGRELLPPVVQTRAGSLPSRFTAAEQADSQSGEGKLRDFRHLQLSFPLAVSCAINLFSNLEVSSGWVWRSGGGRLSVI